MTPIRTRLHANQRYNFSVIYATPFNEKIIYFYLKNSKYFLRDLYKKILFSFENNYYKIRFYVNFKTGNFCSSCYETFLVYG